MLLPDALAFDSSGNLYVANDGNTVSEFAPGSTTASATYSAGVSEPDALAFDSSGNLYVANSGNSTVSEFSPSVTTPTAGGVVIQSSVESRPMLIGGTNSNASGRHQSHQRRAGPDIHHVDRHGHDRR